MFAVTLLLFTLLIALATKATASTKAQLKHREHRQLHTLHADRGTLRFCRNHPRARVFCTARRLRFTRARIGWTTRELAETRALLNPYRVPAWFRAQAECIYSHESGGYGWHADTGNGYRTGLQFLPSTWLRAGGSFDRFANASVAEIVYRAWVITGHGRTWHEWSTAGMCGL